MKMSNLKKGTVIGYRCFLNYSVLSALILASLFTFCGCSTSGQETVQVIRESAFPVSGAYQESGFTDQKTLVPESERPSDPDTCALIVVHVCGAVYRPGVYALPDGSRASDAVEAAGGLKEDAAQEGVNLAAFLTDAQQLYVPSREEYESAGAGWHFTSEGDTGQEPVDINQADAALLEALPGIGAQRAADIIAYRQEHGRFSAIEELMQVPGIGEGIFERLKSHITVN